MKTTLISLICILVIAVLALKPKKRKQVPTYKPRSREEILTSLNKIYQHSKGAKFIIVSKGKYDYLKTNTRFTSTDKAYTDGHRNTIIYNNPTEEEYTITSISQDRVYYRGSGEKTYSQDLIEFDRLDTQFLWGTQVILWSFHNPHLVL